MNLSNFMREEAETSNNAEYLREFAANYKPKHINGESPVSLQSIVTFVRNVTDAIRIKRQ